MDIVDHETLLGWLTRLKLTAIRDQLDSLLDEAAEKKLTLREALAFLNHDVDHTERCSRPASPRSAQRRCAATGSRAGCVVSTAARPHGYRCHGRRRFAVSARATVTDRKEVTVSNRPSDDGKSRMLRIVRDVCANVSG